VFLDPEDKLYEGFLSLLTQIKLGTPETDVAKAFRSKLIRKIITATSVSGAPIDTLLALMPVREVA
jgi:LPS sulfotransferase NodH